MEEAAPVTPSPAPPSFEAEMIGKDFNVVANKEMPAKDWRSVELFT